MVMVQLQKKSLSLLVMKVFSVQSLVPFIVCVSTHCLPVLGSHQGQSVLNVVAGFVESIRTETMF